MIPVFDFKINLGGQSLIKGNIANQVATFIPVKIQDNVG
jgi:hypothetical protein